MINKHQIQKQTNKNNEGESNEMLLERQAHVNSVLRIIHESIGKLRISLILSKIFENPTTLRKCLSTAEYDNCIKLVHEYTREKELDNSKNTPHLNYRLIQIIDFFHKNNRLFEYFPNGLDDLTQEDKLLLQSFDALQYISRQRLEKSALSELNKEKQIHEIYHENEVLKKNIKVFQNQLQTQRVHLKWKFAAKESVIRKYEEDLAIRKYENNIKIKQEIVKSSRNIQEIHEISLVKQKELKEDLERTRVSYKQLLKDNLKQEKSARDEKNKLLLQLQSLIKKFDQTIGEKIKENMFLQSEYERQKQLFDEFMIEYNREEAEYDRIVRAKEEEEKRQQEQKIMLFMMNRAARVVQKHWRKFRKAQRKAAKKGKGRGKGKKK